MSEKNKKILNRIAVGVFALIVLMVLFFWTCTFSVREGTCAIVKSFGEVKAVYEDAGLKLKAPWPFSEVTTIDTRNQYMDSSLTETLTSDKKNIIIQNYVIWNVSDAELFINSVGDFDKAEQLLDDLVTNENNSVLGTYSFDSLINTDLSMVKLDEINATIASNVSTKALSIYGIEIVSLNIKRLALPDANIESVLNQMIADRNLQATLLIAEGEAEAAIIISQGNVDAEALLAAGKVAAAEIDAETEAQIAAIYKDLYDQDSELFMALKEIIALENSVGEDTVFIVKSGDWLFEVLKDTATTDEE